MADLRALAKLIRPALRPVGNAASFATVDWTVRSQPGRTRAYLRVRVTNEAGEREIMLHDVRVEPSLLSHGSLEGLTVRTDLRSLDPAYPPRTDRYWTAFVVHPHDATEVEVEVDVEGAGTDDLYAVCVLLHLDLYGAEGIRRRVHPTVLPLGRLEAAPTLDWRPAGPPAGTTGPGPVPAGAGLQVAPIRTSLLTPVDDVVEVAKRYAGPHVRPGDVLTIGESPLAVMQGRFRHPSEISVAPLTRRLCYLLSGEGSLGTGPGLQALIDEVGLRPVLLALGRGLAGKLQDRDGDFYRALGPQSRLIDDVTGTLPPYDRFLVLGPLDPDRVAQEVGAALGIDVAVVDANDLGNVDVIGATPGVDVDLVVEALRTNPAGNGAETTPLVLVRRSAPEPE